MSYQVPVIERARRYLANIHAVSGNGGHTATFNAAMAAVKGFSLSPDAAMAVLKEWNEANASPQWTERELAHKIREAAKSPKPSGYLLANNRPEMALHAFAEGGRLSPYLEGEETARKARLRSTWPTFRHPSPEETERIASLRSVSTDAVALLAHAGILRATTVDGHPCVIIREGAFAQARRLDGHPLRLRDGREVKAKNLPGSEGLFLGRKWLGGPQCPVLLVEGALALLEAVSAALSVDADVRDPAGWTFIAATSASSRFNAEWLALLAGRRIRIAGDNDAAGREAVAKWTASLRTAGCVVDAVRIPQPFKDLGDVLKTPDAQAFAASLFRL